MEPGCGEWRVEAVDAEKMIDKTKVEASVVGAGCLRSPRTPELVVLSPLR